MPFYIRKSVSFGPVRVNFSKSGVGVSAGVRGLRFGTGPRGHYVRAGVGGIYYRQSPGERTRPVRSQPGNYQGRRTELPPLTHREKNVEMVEIDSAPVNDISDETFAAIMDDVVRRRRRPRLAIWLPLMCIAAAIAVAVAQLPPAFAGLFILLLLPSILLGLWIDSSRRNSVVAYDLDDELQDRYADMCEAFDELIACAKAWHIGAAGNIQDYHTSKRNAGANTLVDLKPTLLRYRQPKAFKSNITPPSMTVGRQTIYLFPDVLLIEEGNMCGGAQYRELDVTVEAINQVEGGALPSDAQVVGETWRYPNKSGGPDKRFRDNKRLPICRYEILTIKSASGITEVLQFSRVGPASLLAHRMEELRV